MGHFDIAALENDAKKAFTSDSDDKIRERLLLSNKTSLVVTELRNSSVNPEELKKPLSEIERATDKNKVLCDLMKRGDAVAKEIIRICKKYGIL